MQAEAATAAGKSKILPSAVAKHCGGKTLVLTPSTIDVEDMCYKALYPQTTCMVKSC